jgi:GntR family transcriptional regulator/MocR family aminotransferase
MDLILDGNGPRYLQVVRALKDAINSGRLPNGMRLPSSRELCAELGVSRTTVVAAYEHLHAEGLIRGKVGSGSYVTSPRTAPSRPQAACIGVLPQSDFSRRSRQVFDIADLPGRRPPGMRHAFQFGLPMVNPRLSVLWARELARAAPYVRPEYPSVQGLPALREAICRHINRSRGVMCTPDDILIVNGAQQAFSLISRVLLDPGEAVVIEEPHYHGVRKILQIHGARLCPVAVDANGLRTAGLPDPAAKLVIVTPSHQFPTGAVLSLERRRALLDYARSAGTWICEDDYDGEFRSENAPVQALQAMDRDGRVLYVGTFSKTLFPSLRLGYIAMPPALKQDLLAAKWADDFGSSPAEQAALARIISSGAYDRHLRLVTRHLAERRGLLQRLLQGFCGNAIDVRPAHTGMHLVAWIRSMPRAEGEAFIRFALERQLALYPVDPCYLTPPDGTGLIMGFSAMSVREMHQAVRLFSDTLAAFAGSRPTPAFRSVPSRSTAG